MDAAGRPAERGRWGGKTGLGTDQDRETVTAGTRTCTNLSHVQGARSCQGQCHVPLAAKRMRLRGNSSHTRKKRKRTEMETERHDHFLEKKNKPEQERWQTRAKKDVTATGRSVTGGGNHTDPESLWA